MEAASFARRGVLVAVVIAAAIIFCASRLASAQSSCPAGNQPAGEGDIATMKAAGIVNAVVGMCWNPSNPAAGAAAGDAKQWLEQHATTEARISCLNAQFAEKLQKLMQAVPGGVPTITSAYRDIASEQKNIQTGAASLSNPCQSYHLHGLAADFNNSSKQTMQWLRENASAYGLSPVTNANPSTGCTASGFCDTGHIQMAGAIPAGDQCGVCNASGSGTLPANSVQTPSSAITQAVQQFFGPQAGITQTPGLGANGPSSGVTQLPGGIQAYCVATTIMYQDSSGNVTQGQICPSGCQNGMCVQAQQCVSNGSSLVLTSSCQSTQCPTGYTSNNGLCVQQQCPSGYTMVNGLCNQTPQQAQQQQTQPTPTQSTTPATPPSTAATTPASTQTLSPSNTQSTDGVTTSSITSPTLVPNLGTSTIAQIQAFANPSPTNAITTTAATETPITLSGAAQDITQLQPTSSPSVTYAQSPSSLSQNGQPGSNSGAGTNGITTTSGTGYDTAGGTNGGNSNSGPAYATGDIASTQPAPGTNTFASGNLSNSPAAPSYLAPSTFSSALAILGVLKNEVLGALQFLSTYTKPFGGIVPSQQQSE